MSNEKLFFGGLPTEYDVNALREHYSETQMKPGTIMPYKEVERIIDCEKGSCRFQTVTNRWRRLVEKESGFIIGTERGVGFKVLKENQKVDLGFSKLRSAVRSSRRAYVVAGSVNVAKLSTDDRNRLTFVQKKASAVICAAQQKGKEAELPKLVEA